MGFPGQGRVGPRPAFVRDRTQNIWVTPGGAHAVQQGHPDLFECSRRGNLWTAFVASVAPGTAIGGTTPPLAVYNPTGSGKWLVLQEATLSLVSGTWGTTAIEVAFAAQVAAPTGGTAKTPLCNLIGNVTAGVALAYSGATTSAIGKLCDTGLLGSAVASKEDLRGKIVVPPGYVVALQGVGSGQTTPLCSLGLTWEEVGVFP